MARDAKGRVYFIDHNTQKTTWNDPRKVSYEQLQNEYLPFNSHQNHLELQETKKIRRKRR